jgi:hypothetical protein
MFKSILFIFILISCFSSFIFADTGVTKTQAANYSVNKITVTQSTMEGNLSTIHTSGQFKTVGIPSNLPEQFDKKSVEGKSNPVSNILRNLSGMDKSNSIIQLEVDKVLSQSMTQSIKNIESKWNNGNIDKAIEELLDFEKQYGANNVAVGISWKVAKPMTHLKGADVLVSSIMDVQNYTIDFHEPTGNLFAVLQVVDTSGTNRWTVNISTDGGTSWSETYNWFAGYTINDVNAAIVADYLYIGYIASTGLDGRIRRCLASDGTIDGTFGSPTVVNEGIVLKEVALVSLFTGAQVYYVTIADDDSIRFNYANNGTALTWFSFQTGINDADHGLDAHMNENSSDNTYMVISYVNSNGRLHAALFRSSFADDYDLADATTNTSDVTSIAAWQDTIMVVYEDANDDILYRISYNNGTTWLWSTIASDPTNSYNKPHVAGRKDGGFAVIYSEEAGAFDPIWFRHRDYSGGWSIPLQVNEIDVGSAMPNNIEWIPPVSADYAHGALFNVSFVAYFDRIEEIIVPAPENLMAADGYNHAIPLYWDAPAGFTPLKIFTGSAIGRLKENLNVQSTVLNTESVLLSYNVYRSTTSGGPYTLLDNVDRQYYRDMTASNGVTYYYVVEAVFDDATSGYSDEGSATAVSNGNVINSGWTGTTPNINGVISAGEWVNATTSDIRGTGVTLPVTLFTMNDGNYLYFAVDDPNDTSATTSDQIGIYFDENQDFEWGQTSPAEEGNYWIQYSTAPAVISTFRGIYGWWPAYLNYETADSAIAVVSGIAYSNGHVQYEVQIDLTNSAFNASPGDNVGMYLFSYDPSIGALGHWPDGIDLFGSTWNAPFLYGTLNLADDPLGIDDEAPFVITKYQLLQNYPNPFNPSTTIKYRIASQKPQSTTLQIYNNLGQLVRTLVNAEQGNGEYTIVWDGLDSNNKEVASGLYFYKLQSGEFISTQKLLKLK